MNPIEHYIEREGHKLYVRDYPGPGAPIVLMHGFPDSLELYDFLLPHLTSHRRVVTFDFLGWGRSDKPGNHRYTFDSLRADLDAVVNFLRLEKTTLVAHDASGPPTINWALANPDNVGDLVLLNTFYMWTLRLRPPEAIFFYMTPPLNYAIRFLNLVTKGRLNYSFYHWQLRRFIREREVKKSLVPDLYRRWVTSYPAFQQIVGTLLPTIYANARRDSLARLRAYAGRVVIIFGAKDPYLNVNVAKRFHREFSNSKLFVLANGYHYVQVDEPAEVARLILNAAEA